MRSFIAQQSVPVASRVVRVARATLMASPGPGDPAGEPVVRPRPTERAGGDAAHVLLAEGGVRHWGHAGVVLPLCVCVLLRR